MSISHLLRFDNFLNSVEVMVIGRIGKPAHRLEADPTKRLNMIVANTVRQYAKEGGAALNLTENNPDVYKYLIENLSNPGDTVLSLGTGSGADAIAALRAGRSIVTVDKHINQLSTAHARLTQLVSAHDAKYDADDQDAPMVLDGDPGVVLNLPQRANPADTWHFDHQEEEEADGLVAEQPASGVLDSSNQSCPKCSVSGGNFKKCEGPCGLVMHTDHLDLEHKDGDQTKPVCEACKSSAEQKAAEAAAELVKAATAKQLEAAKKKALAAAKTAGQKQAKK